MLENLFKLAKLTIKAYTDVERQTPLPEGHEFVVMFNPASFTMRYGNTFQNQQGINTGTAQAKFSHGNSKVLSLTLVLDGTGVADYGLENLLGLGTASVADQVDQFLTSCFHLNGAIHEPNFLRVHWGTKELVTGFKCRLQSVDVNYTSFDRDGSPLRAELATTFVEDVDPEAQAALEGRTSPDLSHARVVRSGDTLPLLCAEIYGSPRHYLRVARVNELDDFRNLSPGQTLLFPPFERGRKG